MKFHSLARKGTNSHKNPQVTIQLFHVTSKFVIRNTFREKTIETHRNQSQNRSPRREAPFNFSKELFSFASRSVETIARDTLFDSYLRETGRFSPRFLECRRMKTPRQRGDSFHRTFQRAQHSTLRSRTVASFRVFQRQRDGGKEDEIR